MGRRCAYGVLQSLLGAFRDSVLVCMWYCTYLMGHIRICNTTCMNINDSVYVSVSPSENVVVYVFELMCMPHSHTREQSRSVVDVKGQEWK